MISVGFVHTQKEYSQIYIQNELYNDWRSFVRKLQFTVHSLDFVRQMHCRAMLAATCYVSHASDILWTPKQV